MNKMSEDRMHRVGGLLNSDFGCEGNPGQGKTHAVKKSASADEMLENGLDLSSYRNALKIVMDTRDQFIPGISDYFGAVILDSVEEYLIDKTAAARHVWRQGRTKAEYPSQSVDEWFEYEELQHKRIIL